MSTVLLMPMQTPLDFNMTENNVIRRRRSSSSADTGDSGLPAKILTASHLSTLRYLVSDKKITGCAQGFATLLLLTQDSMMKSKSVICQLLLRIPSTICKCVFFVCFNLLLCRSKIINTILHFYLSCISLSGK